MEDNQVRCVFAGLAAAVGIVGIWSITYIASYHRDVLIAEIECAQAVVVNADK